MNANSQQTEEEAFVRAFIVPEKRDRYLQMLTNPKKRDKITKLLYHHLDIVAGRSVLIPSRDHMPAFAEKLLRQKEAKNSCYLISPEQELDQQVLPLSEALEALIMQDSVAVVCCVPGRLAYYKAELRGYVLEAPA